ncbi:ubiquitin carboxyl-terminal hydrolase 30 homolog [Aedes albopictus]|uniref:USP domain-containing protein n=1 Tax=Aedes albopictus TaxID=7160 RepID=A0ABM1Z8J8_AEDAL
MFRETENSILHQQDLPQSFHRRLSAGVTAAVVVGAVVFWGPSGNSRLIRQKRSQIAGLHNFGKTCFLNALFQSLPVAVAQHQGHENVGQLIASDVAPRSVFSGSSCPVVERRR